VTEADLRNRSLAYRLCASTKTRWGKRCRKKVPAWRELEQPGVDDLFFARPLLQSSEGGVVECADQKHRQLLVAPISMQYSYNSNGQATTVTDNVNPGQGVTSYTYDNLDRLNSATTPTWTLRDSANNKSPFMSVPENGRV
jgi:hypothetical protein